MKRTVSAARGRVAHQGRTWWIVRRAELVVERIGSRTLNFCGRVAWK